MVKTMKRLITIAGLFAALIFGINSCQDHVILETTTDPVQDGYVRIRFKAEVPDMAEVKTKVVDPDGEDISNMTLFCFDSRGLFLSTVSAQLTQGAGIPSLSGTFDAVIPEYTEKIHFMANQNMNIFRENEFIGKTETEVLSAMEGSSGMMIYWARFAKDASASTSVAEQLKSMGTVSLVRNHAKISIADNPAHSAAIIGFVAVNTNAFGTVAPYSDTHGWVIPSYSNGQVFVTIPHNESKLSDINDVRSLSSEPEQYVFECENTSDDPVSVIILDADGKYYRVMLMDTDGEFIPIMRNHSYEIHIEGELSYGQATFDAALTAPATNNIWLSVSDEIKTVIGNGYQLSVDQTHVVISEIPADKKLTLGYSLLTDAGAAPQNGEAPSVSWLAGNTVAQQSFVNTFSSGEGSVTVTLNELAANETAREGTLLVKYGTLQRKIKITTLPLQKFEPAWITTNVYGTGTGEKVTMMFHIPESFPAEMFPMDVLVSVNDIDVRSESGMILPVITSEDERYGNPVYLNHAANDVFTPASGTDKPIGYKYVFTVEEPGTQRLYLETILSHSVDTFIEVTIEAEHFAPLTKVSTFQNEENQYILIHNLRSYVAAKPADDVIYFYLVPAKKGARVEFPTHLGKDIDWNDDHTVRGYTAVTPSVDDEFLFYSQYLDHNTATTDTKYFDFYEIDKQFWATGGRVHGFKSKGNLTDDGGATFHMITNSSDANEVVRIASNPKGQQSVTGSGTSNSSPYRSAVFELSTFHPFHFAAEFNGEGTVIEGQNEEVTDNVSIKYGKGNKAEIEFDVTSFMSHIQTVTSDSEQLSVDPFGREFDIYIDAPMLELDQDALASSGLSGKVKEDPSVPGRFVYTVDASREVERTYGFETASIRDNSTHTYLDRESTGLTVDQTKERKLIPFKTKEIVSAGDIVISSEQEEVRFYTKTFKLSNESITGTIQYVPDGGSAANVPARSFVPMERTYDGTRIGSMTITVDGTYELRLRAEYDFDWNTDEIMFEFNSGGVHYSVTVSSLASLVNNPNLVLVPTAGH